MSDYEIEPEEAEEALRFCDKLLEGGELTHADGVYISHVKDTIGWMLGYYDDPLEPYRKARSAS